MKRLLYSSLLMATLVSTANASQIGVENWYMGDTTCNIDGRPARMNWKVENEWVGNCNGDICSGYENAKLVGKFSDNGGPWVALARTSSATNTLYIRYLGAEQDNWMLRYDPSTHRATGWTTWRGHRYPLSCWK